MNISFLGGAGEIGASCILVNIGGKNLLLDCGIRQSSSKDVLPDLRALQEKGGVDAVIISHAHMDHIGSLPIVSKEFPYARIYMTTMTKALTRVLLYDSLKIMNNREAEIPLYAENDVINMLDRVFPLNFQTEFEILEGINVCFFAAGHIAGAGCVYITSREGSLFYSGDFSLFSQRTVEGARIPKLRPDAAIFETTYGDKLHSNRELEEERLINVARECIARKGKMLIPAFALGRAQEVLLILKKAMNNNKLNKVNIYVDGMVKDINREYKLNPLYLKSSLGKKILKGTEPFYNEYVLPVTSKEERENILKQNESCIIVSSSGMLTGGPSQYYAEIIASLTEGYIVLTGYQDEESPGRKLLELLQEEDKVLNINNKVIPVRCSIESVGLSAHGDKGEIKALISSLNPKNIFLVHGEQKVEESLAAELQKECFSKIFVPRDGESLEVCIGNPRKQLKKQLPYLMKEAEAFTEKDAENLWSFISKNYGDRLFTAEELIIIWKGTAVTNKDEIQSFQNILLDSIYFQNDMKRFFMFKISSPSEIEEAYKEKELKPNEITELAAQHFKEYNYKKISLQQAEKIMVLNFSFPKAVPSSISDKLKEFSNETGWKVEINEMSDMNAVVSFAKMLLNENFIKKISYYLDIGQVKVQLEGACRDFEEEKKQFKEKTGFELAINGAGTEITQEKSPLLFEAEGTGKMEQNQALDYIEKSFSGEEFKPYKKSIKEAGYIELAFISPVIGSEYAEKIKELAVSTGWSIKISDAVNQNEIISLAKILCDERGIHLKKNPSFSPFNLTVTLKAAETYEDAFSEIKNIFEHCTGCSLDWA